MQLPPLRPSFSSLRCCSESNAPARPRCWQLRAGCRAALDPRHTPLTHRPGQGQAGWLCTHSEPERVYNPHFSNRKGFLLTAVFPIVPVLPVPMQSTVLKRRVSAAEKCQNATHPCARTGGHGFQFQRLQDKDFAESPPQASNTKGSQGYDDSPQVHGARDPKHLQLPSPFRRQTGAREMRQSGCGDPRRHLPPQTRVLTMLCGTDCSDGRAAGHMKVAKTERKTHNIIALTQGLLQSGGIPNLLTNRSVS